MGKRPRIELRKNLTDAVMGGHPWIYDRALARTPDRARAGDVIEVASGGGSIAAGYLDPHSPLRVRVLCRAGDADYASDFGDGWARALAASCARMRRADPALTGVTARRLIHGENDHAPGLVVDVYETTAVVVFDGRGPAAFWTPRLDAVLGGLESEVGPFERVWLRPRGQAPRSHRGGAPPDEIRVAEGPIHFAVDVVRGQKTGLFLDQRDNRRRVAEHASGATVANLFSYNGGFSIAAALGGARRTTSVDIATPALVSARRSFELSNADPRAHDFVARDVFEFAADAIQRGQRFDIVVCDPPSFASSAAGRGKALAAYRRLAEACLRLVEADGLLVFASCSSHVSDSDLLAVLGQGAARTGRTVRVRGVYGPATDHPVRPGFPEGRYLSAIFAWIT